MSVGSWLIGVTTGVRSMITSVSCKFLTAESQFGTSLSRLAKLLRLGSAGRASLLEGCDGASESMSLVWSEIILIKKDRWRVHLTFRRRLFRWMSIHELGTTW